jgi:excinuclease ABC subunit C
MASKEIKEQLRRLPRKPGVYQFFNADGEVIYVGKAKILKNRVSSYFSRKKYDSGKTRILASKVASIEVIVVETEPDALFLENSLIKKFQPRYNMQLKDDKSFPSLVIKKERFPRIFATRRLIQDGSEYYGPYASVKSMHAILDLIKKLYPIRTCNFQLSKENIEKGKFKICLEYHLGNCLGPCEDRMSEEDYEANVNSIRTILKGDFDSLIKDQKELMTRQSENLDFELAHKTSKQMDLLEHFQAKSTIVNPKIQNVDVFTVVSDSHSAYINYMKVNKGAIVHGHSFEVKKKLDESEDEILAYVIPSFREKAHSFSKMVLLNTAVDLDIDGVEFHVPQRGDKRHLVQLSEKNARFFMRDQQKQVEQVDPDAHMNRILSTLQEDLRLKELPIHIECFDNSNIQGTNPASACVVFKNAKPSKGDYRKFNIKTVDGPNDFASMTEVVERRYRRLVDEGESLPQLLIIDGGKGQLSAALQALDKLGLRGQIPIIGIAKRLEEIYFPGDTIPIYLDKRSESLKLIQHLRNEAHRFSLSHHRSRRSKGAIDSELTSIPHVGEKSVEDLLRHFKSVKRIREATLAELEAVVSKRAAKAVWAHFQPK